jgi:hypothetical protein
MSKLALLQLQTKSGATYVFPDMDVDAVKKILPEAGRLPAEDTSSLILTNITGAVLVVPLRVVACVLLDNEVVWASPV